ncbi:hypothetical protein PGIGA_G00101090 [Pangasianodon gigas]|uniref:Uncharacterized protein n=1 Tax=Pangasianodon gigas TaxID=30993 RepID=A0ACC5XEI4_PANGG|nr:hypothetical protein [Pangasianodon gigas]
MLMRLPESFTCTRGEYQDWDPSGCNKQSCFQSEVAHMKSILQNTDAESPSIPAPSHFL